MGLIEQSSLGTKKEILSVNTIEIRTAEFNDLEQICRLAIMFEAELDVERVGFTVDNIPVLQKEIARLYCQRLLSGMTEGLRHVILVAEEYGTNSILGYAIGHVPDPKPEHNFYALLRGNYVLPEYRGKNIGKKLYAGFKDEVRQIGASSIELEVQENGMGYLRLTKNAIPLREILLPDGTKRIRFKEDVS